MQGGGGASAANLAKAMIEVYSQVRVCGEGWLSEDTGVVRLPGSWPVGLLYKCAAD